ncbi:MAG TPA: CvpA family protein [Candidatus Eisenbergiella merdigallinarum]|uniref:CvpA family protein n=1 Tax=Candidatus Eisenbergiella merdigallinarum TaxID=2838552 RepID=A0A9D2MQF6_9FIRM|nr:CvpA family protein [Candidatus Eisenbergiella merdigallinarum]
MKKGKRALLYGIGIVAALVAVFVYYYITLPAINIHSSGFWFFLLALIAAAAVVCAARKAGKEYRKFGKNARIDWKGWKPLRLFAGVFIAVLAVYLIGDLLSSPIINAKKYQQLLTVEERNFTDDVREVDYSTIPLLDKDSATLLGDRKMGSLVEMVSQFEAADDYTQINYQGKPVRVTPLVYASPIKWLTNQRKGIPAYIMIDMTTQDTEVVMLEEGIRYSKSEYFNRNLYRHLRFRFPTYIFDDQLFFEIDESGTPYWVCPVKKFNIGLFGGQTVGRVVLCNAITGECVDYAVEDVPQWIDKVYSAELLMDLYDYHGVLVHGYFNSVLGQKDCIRTTEGYNYIALDDDVWVYTGLTSVNGDQSNVGFALMNQRTMETRYYKVEGATETSAMASAEGQVQNLKYQASFPLLLNISGEPTYFVALKDGAGLVKKYAMINVEKYQWVAIGDTVQECERNYSQLLETNGIESTRTEDLKKVTGVIEVIAPVVIEGNTHYYICLEGQEGIFDVDLSNEDLIGIVRYQEGDRISLSCEEGAGLHSVADIP